MDRWILSLGIDWARAAMTAARSREFASGSGRPILAATGISRLSLEKRGGGCLSCAPFRYMMFLNLLWPAIARSLRQPERLAIGLQHRVLLLAVVGLHSSQPYDHAHDLGVVAVGLGLGVDVADIVGDALLLFLEALDPLDEQPQLIGRDGAFRHAL